MFTPENSPPASPRDENEHDDEAEDYYTDPDPAFTSNRC